MSELEAAKQAAEEEVRRLKELSGFILGSPGKDSNGTSANEAALKAELDKAADQQSRLQTELHKEAILRKQSLDLACSRDEYLARTLQNVEQETERLRNVLRVDGDAPPEFDDADDDATWAPGVCTSCTA